MKPKVRMYKYKCVVRCGCCDKKVVIWFPCRYEKKLKRDAHLIEINGVIATRAEWRRILGA